MKQTSLFTVNEVNIKNVYLDLVKTDNARTHFNRIVKTHHSYVPTTNYGGRQINWLVKDNKNTLGAIGLGSAIMALSDRDKFIGWNKETRLKNLTKIGNNWRYCLIDSMPNLGTKVLSLFVKEGKKEWLNKYGDELSLIETLVEPPHTGKVYSASSWITVGKTKGAEFKWINKKNSDEYINAGWHVCKKHVQYGDKVDHNKWQVVRENAKKRKIIFVKPLNHNWKKKLNKNHGEIH